MVLTGSVNSMTKGKEIVTDMNQPSFHREFVSHISMTHLGWNIRNAHFGGEHNVCLFYLSSNY